MSNEAILSPNKILSNEFLKQYPNDSARVVENLAVKEAVKIVKSFPAEISYKMVSRLAPSVAAAIISNMKAENSAPLLAKLSLNQLAVILSRLTKVKAKKILALLSSDVQAEIKLIMQYPEDTAGNLMDTRILAFNHHTTVGDTKKRLREFGVKALSKLFLLDDSNKLKGQVDIYRFVLAEDTTTLNEIAMPAQGVVNAMQPKEDLIATLEKHKINNLPVVDADNHLLGIIHSDKVLDTLKESIASDLQTMVGAGKEEKALSPSLFAVRKRIFWLHINLLTAFLAAFVVGIFEGTIAKYTALAVLLPVVAGQSGNAGSQALAVTMRSLTLREITNSDWLKVAVKEFFTGLVNGIAIAITCSISVYVWSKSIGLSLIIIIAMIFSMAAACVSGAITPIILRKFGQDPAQSSSIILTTITDVAGFFSFLGTATLLASYI